MFKHIFNHTKFPQLKNLIHSFVYIGLLPSSAKFTSPCSLFDGFPYCAYLISDRCFQHFSKMMNGFGWLDDCHIPSLILYDTVPFFVYTDQLLCHCSFICSNVRWQLVYLLRDGFLYCFCLLTESYETIDPSINQSMLDQRFPTWGTCRAELKCRAARGNFYWRAPMT